jgi:flavin-dependent dehydrogenase
MSAGEAQGGSFDVVVIGGGPAGAAAAYALARAGRSVVLAERSTYAEWRAGESLLPAARPLLETLGVWTEFAADGHVPSVGVEVVWGDGVPRMRDYLFSPIGEGWHLDRRRFDARLATAAAAAGAQVLRGARVMNAAPAPQGGWRVSVQAGEAAPREIVARVAVDATGRAAWLAQRAGARRLTYDRLLGLAAAVTGAAADGDAAVLLLEAAPAGWWYSVTLPDGALLAAYMTDDDVLTPGQPPAAQWHAALPAAPHTAARVARHSGAVGVQVRGARTVRLERAAGADWLAVGDAACARDPLSADGICQAVRSGLAAAEAIDARLRGDGEALARYEARTFDAFARYLDERAVQYGAERRWPASPFWRRRHGPRPDALPVTLDPRARLALADRAGGGGAAAIAEAAAGLLPLEDAAALAALLAAPIAAHEVVATLRRDRHGPPADRSAIVALQALLAAGVLRRLV